MAMRVCMMLCWETGQRDAEITGGLPHDAVVGDEWCCSLQAAGCQMDRIESPQGGDRDALGDQRPRFVQNPPCDGMQGEPSAALPKRSETLPRALAGCRI